MKKIQFFLSFIIFITIVTMGCDDPNNPNQAPTVTVTPLTSTSGWHNDTIRYQVEISSPDNFTLEITPDFTGANQDASVSKSYSSINVTYDYEYVIPEDATEGQDIVITFSATNSSGKSRLPIQQIISVTEYGGSGNPVTHYGGALLQDETWSPENNPHTVDGTVWVKGVKLTILPGTIIQFTKGSSIKVGGAENSEFIAHGTENQRIKFTSKQSTKQADDWKAIEFKGQTTSNTGLKNCVIEYGGDNGTDWGMINIADCSVHIDSCEIQHARLAITLNDNAYFESFTHNTIQNISETLISINAAYLHTLGEGNQMTANDGYGISIPGGDVNQITASWLYHGTPYIFNQDVKIGSSAATELTIAPGNELLFNSGTAFYIGAGGLDARLIAQGTSDKPIIFSSLQSTPAAGDWEGIYFGANTLAESKMDTCMVAYGGQNDSQANITIDGVVDGEPLIQSCTITHSSTNGIYKKNGANPTLNNNTFSDNALDDVATEE